MKVDLSMRRCPGFMFLFGLNLEQMLILIPHQNKWTCDISHNVSFWMHVFCFPFSEVSELSYSCGMLVSCTETLRGAHQKAGETGQPTVLLLSL